MVNRHLRVSGPDFDGLQAVRGFETRIAIRNTGIGTRIARILFRRPDGNLETYVIPWTKSGLALTSIGKYITPRAEPQLRSSYGSASLRPREGFTT